MRLMTDNTPDDAAVDWFVRMNSGDVSRSTRLEHEAWLAEDDRNRERFEAVQRSMGDLAPLDDWMDTEVDRLNARVAARHAWRNRGLVGLASAAAAVAVVTVWITTNPADFYTTERAEQREISLDDGSRIHLNTASSVAVRYSSEERTVELNSGEGVFDVSRDAQRPFVVAAADAEVVAIGTQFRVRLGGGDVTVTVLEGAVAVFNRPTSGATEPGSGPSESEPTLLYANDQITMSNGVMTAVESVNASVATAWREGKLIYHATPLRQVVAEMSRYTPIELAVADGVPDHPITGLIQIRSPDAMLRFISNAVPVTPVRASKERIVLHASPTVPE